MNLPVVISIAGSDNSAGAGIQADLKTFSALDVYGVTAVTCIVAEVPGRVKSIQAVDPEIVADQIRLLFEAFPIKAVKTGMLYSREIISAVVATLEECFSGANEKPFLVVDPVMVATSGDPLLQSDAVSFYKDHLFPMAGIVTPNLDEVETLIGRAVKSVEEMRIAGLELADQFKTAFLIKGGHLKEDIATDLLVLPSGEITKFHAPFVRDVSTHGTGCTYSAAIAAGMAKGLPLAKAVGEAKTYVTSAIKHFLRWERDGVRTDALRH